MDIKDCNCKDCKHWEWFMKLIKNWGKCEILKNKIINDNGVGVDRGFFSVEDFGCKFWERREK